MGKNGTKYEAELKKRQFTIERNQSFLTVARVPIHVGVHLTIDFSGIITCDGLIWTD